MSVSYWCYAAIGVKIDPKKLMRMEIVRNCHCETEPTGKYCSNCGKEAFEEIETPIEIFEDQETILGYKVIYGTDHKESIIAAFEARAKDFYEDKKKSFQQLPDNLKEIREKMRDSLGPLGLWDEKKFGLWSILYCSY